MKCVFFDRDGIVNRSPGAGYVERWEDFELMPEFPSVLHVATDMGYAAVIVTNQRGVALGLMTLGAVERIHENLRRVLHDEHGLDVLDVLFCPHDRDECDCRKPSPGMLLAAARKHGIDLASSWLVGDHDTDVEAGRRAGCRTVLVAQQDVEPRADVRVADMAELSRRLRGILAGQPDGSG